MEVKYTQKISCIMTRMREDGAIDWRAIVDDSRIARRVTQWDSPEQIIESSVKQYRKNYWQDQEIVVEVWSEKSTIKGILQPVLDKWGVTFRPFKGFGSFTVVKQAAEDNKAIEREGKLLDILYLGDHDPSGRYMSDVDLPSRLQRYGARGVELDRIAVDMDTDSDLPPFAAKRTDKRYQWFTERYGNRCIEVDALDPNVLRQRVSDRIRRSIDMEKWERMVAVEEAEKASMVAFMEQWNFKAA
jgi:hypothetical protein